MNILKKSEFFKILDLIRSNPMYRVTGGNRAKVKPKDRIAPLQDVKQSVVTAVHLEPVLNAEKRPIAIYAWVQLNNTEQYEGFKVMLADNIKGSGLLLFVYPPTRPKATNYKDNEYMPTIRWPKDLWLKVQTAILQKVKEQNILPFDGFIESFTWKQ